MMNPSMNAIDGGNRRSGFRLKRETTGRANIPPCSDATKEGALSETRFGYGQSGNSTSIGPSSQYS